MNGKNLLDQMIEGLCYLPVADLINQMFYSSSLILMFETL